MALGIDYSIFLMTRVREESIRLGTRPGILKGLAVTGGVITSAGVVLAATFAALGVLPILFLAQIAFIVAFGVLLDTIVVRSLFVPSVVLPDRQACLGAEQAGPPRRRRPRDAAVAPRPRPLHLALISAGGGVGAAPRPPGRCSHRARPRTHRRRAAR